jgi:selenide,water dikinase
MGATPQTALALATIPLAAEKIMSDDLTQLMSGVLKALSDDKVELIGGHSCEGPEMSLGLAINGYSAEKNLIRKTGAKNGDALILTKSLGTGVIFAAMMQGKAQSRWIKFATEMMMTSNKNASEIFVSHQASSMTDITGFGLCGHIVEMLDTSDLHASLASSALPILPGALSLFEKGYESSLQASNLKLGKAVNVKTDLKGILNIAFDPQTSGGLLATIPQDEVQSCLKELKERGYPMAVVIGKICNRQSQHTITLT